MTAKDFLRKARRSDQRTLELEERLERISARLDAGRLSRLTGMPRGGGYDWTALADRKLELERKLISQLSEMVRLKSAAVDAIAAVENPRHRQVLELYYLDGLTWEAVAEEMGVEVRWVYRLHGKALTEIRVPKEVE